MTASPEWWKDFFNGLFIEFWKIAIPDAATKADAEFFARRLALSPGARVLDAPCGHGRFALDLARRGCNVTGVDISQDALAVARASAAAEGLSINWRQSDMRDLPWPGAFDAVLCAGNSFGYFDDAGNAAYLSAAVAALKPGGRFLLDWGWVAESLLPAFREFIDMDLGDMRFTARNVYVPQTGRVENVFAVEKGSVRQERAASHRVYTVSEILRLLEAAGFNSFECFGSNEAEPYRLGAHRLILVAQKGGRPA